MKTLPERLRSIVEHVPRGVSVADIGSDHGFVPMALSQQGNPRVIATDNRPGPVSQCRQNVQSAAVSVEVRCGDGLEPLQESEVEWIVISGMSGRTIGGILHRSLDKARTFHTYLLQPMQHDRHLRRYLHDCGWGITKEWVVKEGARYYVLMQVVPHSIQRPSLHQWYAGVDMEFLLEVGPALLLNRDGLTHEYLAMQTARWERVGRQLQGKHTRRLEEVEEHTNTWRKVMACHAQYRDACR